MVDAEHLVSGAVRRGSLISGAASPATGQPSGKQVLMTFAGVAAVCLVFGGFIYDTPESQAWRAEKGAIADCWAKRVLITDHAAMTAQAAQCHEMQAAFNRKWNTAGPAP